MRQYLQNGIGIGVLAAVFMILVSLTPFSGINLMILLLAMGLAGHMAGNRGQNLLRCAREGAIAGAVTTLLTELWGVVSGGPLRTLRQQHASAAAIRALENPVQLGIGVFASVLIFSVVGAFLGVVGGFVGQYASRTRRS